MLLCSGIALTTLGELKLSLIGLYASLAAMLSAVIKLILLDTILSDHAAANSTSNHVKKLHPYGHIEQIELDFLKNVGRYDGENFQKSSHARFIVYFTGEWHVVVVHLRLYRFKTFRA